MKHCSSYFISIYLYICTYIHISTYINIYRFSPHKNLVNNYYYILFLRLGNCNIHGFKNLPKITKILSILCLTFGGFSYPQNKVKSQLHSKTFHDLNLRSYSVCSPPPKPMVQPYGPSPQFPNTVPVVSHTCML